MDQGPKMVTPSHAVAALLTEVIYHSARCFDDDFPDLEEDYVDLGDNPDEYLIVELNKRFNDAMENRMPVEGVTEF